MAGMNRLLTTPIDLRSDTVTRPTAAMRAAIAAAEVGDDQYGEDPTTARLQAVCAELLDQEAALWHLVAVAFSKGLGAPGGSLLAGHRDLIRAADRHRRMMGGAMRQNGLFAAAALHGLVEHRARLAEDHAHAREFATLLASCPAVQLDLDTVQSNIVVFHLRDGAPDAATVVGRARELGVLLNAFGPRLVRAVTHLDVDAAQVREAAQRLLRLLG
jgi:threonine aldolase